MYNTVYMIDTCKGQKRVVDPLELDLQTIVTLHVCFEMYFSSLQN